MRQVSNSDRNRGLAGLSGQLPNQLWHQESRELLHEFPHQCCSPFITDIEMVGAGHRVEGMQVVGQYAGLEQGLAQLRQGCH